MKNRAEKIFQDLDFDFPSCLKLDQSIKGIYSNIKCDCFIKKKSDSIKEKLLKNMEELIINSRHDILYSGPSDFVKGVIHLWNNNEKEAYKYLTNMIDFDCQNELYYYLRSTIDPAINPHYLEDAKWAVLLNPTPLNYTGLINALVKDKKWKNNFILKYIDKVIEFEPHCGCMYFEKGKLLENNLTLDSSAITCYKRVLFWDPNNIRVKRKLVFLLATVHDFKLSNHYAKSVLEDNPNDSAVYLKMAENYRIIGEWENCRNYLDKFLELYKFDQKQSNVTESINDRLSKIYYGLALNSYKLAQYKDVLSYLDLAASLTTHSYFEIYFLSILLNHDNSTVIGRDNNHYVKLSNLINNAPRSRGFIKLYFLTDVLRFGKYASKSINEILIIDPNYLIFLILKNNHFAVFNKFFLSEQVKSSPDYYKALEINIIKQELINDYNLDGSHDDEIRDAKNAARDMLSEMQGDWGGLYNDEAESGYWNTD